MKDKGIFEKVPCNLCKSEDYDVVYKANYENEKDSDINQKFRASGDELLIDQVVRCKKCGLKFINPRIKSNVIVKAYSEGEDPVFVSQADARERTFAKSLKRIEKYAKNKGRILDVGTAGGSFLGAAKKMGWETYGCEPNKWMAKWGEKRYGIKIKPGTLFDQNYKDNFFNVVTLWDVIEHTPDPLEVLKECNRILKKDGIMVVNYPDIGSWIARIMGRKWLFLTSVHLYYFTPRTIKLMLNKAGFEVLTIKPHFQNLELGYLFFRAGSYSKLISKIGGWFVKILGLEHKLAPYWLGQTFLIVKKKSNLSR